MTKTIYTLQVDGFSPEIIALTRPLLARYASKIGASLVVMDERRWPGMPVTYEKFQVAPRAAMNRDDWSIFIDADVLIHPDLPDLTEVIPRDHVGFNSVDYAPTRFDADDYFRRDGRHIGVASWLVVCSTLTRDDLWSPHSQAHDPDAFMLTELCGRVHPIHAEVLANKTADHMIDDYLLSRNVARFGLKVTELQRVWAQHLPPGFNMPQFFYHEYIPETAVKVMQMQRCLQFWHL